MPIRRRDRRIACFVVPWLVVGTVAAAPPTAVAPPGVGLAADLAAEDRAALVADVERIGDPARGAAVFHTRHLTCLQCHVAGAGPSPLGPNLAALPPGVDRSRLVPHLVESILDPSAVIRPEHRGVTIITTDGRAVTGLVGSESAAAVVVRDAATGGGETTIPQAEIDQRVPATASLMPTGLANLLADRRQFLDLVRYLADVAVGGAERAAALVPDPAVHAAPAPAAHEAEIDHAAFLADWDDPGRAAAAFRRGAAIYERVCANCHGTRDAPGSLPTAPRFATGTLRHGADPHAMYRTLTTGNGQMVAQSWMVPAQKYDVIHYIREAFLREGNQRWYTAVTPEYLATLPTGTSRGPAPVTLEPWRLHDYGPFLGGSFEAGDRGDNVARKGLAVRLDAGPGGVGRGQAWILHELDTLRMAAFWTGDRFIDWEGINFDGRHGRHPHVAGDVQAVVPTMPGWAHPDTGSFADLRPRGRDGQPYGPLPRDHGRFRALHHVATAAGPAAEPRSAVVLDYLVGSTEVLETAALAPALHVAGATVPVVIRSFSLGPRPKALVVRLAAAPAVAVPAGPQPAVGPIASVIMADGFIDLSIPEGDGPLDVAVAVAVADAGELARHAAGLAVPQPRTLVGRPAPRLWPTVVETALVPGVDTGPFAVDTLAAPEANPWKAQMRFSGLDVTGPDEAVLCTWDGDVWRVGGITGAGGPLAWRRIATGLFQPLGIKVIGGVIHVACRDRIARLVDIDGDGLTDRYETFNDDHQVTEHFHEFAMGLETDAAGNLYYAKSARHALPAVVPHHGTLLRVAADGSSTAIVANGFRAANGVCVEPDGTFWVTDQEGHWNPKNRINHVRPGGFYGNMFGWHDVTDPSDAAMDPPAFWITNAFDRSPAELLRVTSPRWDPITGGLLELSYGEGRVHLVLTEPVAGRPGVVQGGMVRLPIADLPTGVMRGRFHPTDGHLYACGLFAWAGNRTQPGGFFRIRRTAQPVLVPVGLHAAPGEITLTFAAPLDRATAGAPAAWRVRTWGLERSARYGSDHIDEAARAVTAVDVSSDGRRITLRVPDLAATWCYALEWSVRSAAGEPVEGRLHGTLHAPGDAP
jgi:putative heme-binding domain-containing protein